MVKKLQMLFGWLIMLVLAIVDKFSKHLIGLTLVAIVANYFWGFTEYKWMLLTLAIVLPARWIVAAQEDLVRSVIEKVSQPRATKLEQILENLKKGFER